MKASYKIYLLVVLPFFLLRSSFFFNTANAASIQVKVIDAKNGKALVGASILLRGDNIERTGLTDKSGIYHFENLSAGNYFISSSYIGFIALENKPVLLENTNTHAHVELVMTEEIRYLSELVIRGKTDKETDVGSRFAERTAPHVINVISAAAIQISPDITVANVAQRISGVTLVRNALGDGQYAIIRGIDPRYNNTLINGIKIPSPDPTNRFIPLDIIPAQLVQRMEVSKALTPDMEGDAIGGTINVVMKDAPDQPLFSVNVATGYSQLLFDKKFLNFNKSSINFQDPNQSHGGTYYATQDDFNHKNLIFSNRQAPANALAGFTLGKRFLENKLGILVSATNQNIYRAAQSVQTVTVTSALNKPVGTDIISRDYFTQQNRTGINTKADYKINDHNRLEAYGLFLRMNDIQTRFLTDTIFNDPGRYGPGTGKVSVHTRSRYQRQTVGSITLQGVHQVAPVVSLNWSAVYSKAVYEVPDMAEINTYHTLKQGGSFDGASDYLNNVSHSWQHSNDRDYTGYLNLEYKSAPGKFPLTLKAGGLYRAKDRNNYQNDYNLLPSLVKDDRGIPQNPPYTGIDNASLYVYQPVGNPQYNTSNYTAKERIIASYIQGKTEWGKLKILTGVRVELTSQSNRNLTPEFPGYREHFFDYHDILPSVHLNYKLNEKQNVRFSVFKSISRPNYFELVDYTIKGDQFNTVGNPKLRHVRATSFDARYEWYMNSEDVIQAGVFYKNIIDPIEILLDANGGQPAFKPINSGTANNYGVELVFIKYIKNFGLSANYTFTNSSVSSPKISYLSSNGTSVDSLVYVNEKRPLQGQSKHVANAALIYRNPKLNFNCQLALVYQGKRIAQVSQYIALDFYQANYTDLSFSAEQRFLGKFTAFCKLNNLLNTPYTLTTKDGYAYQRDIYKQNYLIGIRFQL